MQARHYQRITILAALTLFWVAVGALVSSCSGIAPNSCVPACKVVKSKLKAAGIESKIVVLEYETSAHAVVAYQDGAEWSVYDPNAGSYKLETFDPNNIAMLAAFYGKIPGAFTSWRYY